MTTQSSLRPWPVRPRSGICISVLRQSEACATLIAHCHLGLGKLYRRTGEREQAQEHLTTATARYREMGTTYWLEQAEAEMKAAG